eukprot:scaffold174452_cov22-Tisochrysis_lutea.AAC.1
MVLLQLLKGLNDQDRRRRGLGAACEDGCCKGGCGRATGPVLWCSRTTPSSAGVPSFLGSRLRNEGVREKREVERGLLGPDLLKLNLLLLIRGDPWRWPSWAFRQ